MKIAQIAPLYEAVPPRLYGGTERIVAHLRGRWCAEGAAHSAMGIWLTRKVCAKERNALEREQ
jgi:hypothetical protein